jgi:hypothetical protein
MRKGLGVRKIQAFARRYPVRTAALITAIIGFLGPTLPDGVVSGLTVFIAAFLGIGVHKQVTPMSKVIKGEGEDHGVWHS